MIPRINFYDISLIDCDINRSDEKTASGRRRGLTLLRITGLKVQDINDNLN